MSEDFKNIVDSSFNNGTPFWTYNKDYIYGMIPADPDGNRWTEVSYTFQEADDPLIKNERSADFSYQFLFEEVEKGIPFYVEDFNVNNVKEYVKTIEGKPGPEKIKSLISELINNGSNYSANLPIIKSKDDLGKLKEKV